MSGFSNGTQIIFKGDGVYLQRSDKWLWKLEGVRSMDLRAGDHEDLYRFDLTRVRRLSSREVLLVGVGSVTLELLESLRVLRENLPGYIDIHIESA